MKKYDYLAPEASLILVDSEQFICSSTIPGAAVDNFFIEDDITNDLFN